MSFDFDYFILYNLAFSKAFQAELASRIVRGATHRILTYPVLFCECLLLEYFLDYRIFNMTSATLVGWKFV